MTTVSELSVIPFASAGDMERWMAKHYANTHGIWIKIAKKASGIPSVTHDEALDIALCYGWIDGQRKGFDETHFLQKFSKRRSNSLWSKRNLGKIAKLTAAGRMQPSGNAEVEAAKSDGRWEAAYDSATTMVFPKDFLNALEKNRKAQAYFNTLGKSSVYVIAFRLATAKTEEARQRRFESMLAMLERGEFR